MAKPADISPEFGNERLQNFAFHLTSHLHGVIDAEADFSGTLSPIHTKRSRQANSEDFHAPPAAVDCIAEARLRPSGSTWSAVTKAFLLERCMLLALLRREL